MTQKPRDTTWPHPSTEPAEERASHGAQKHAQEARERTEEAARHRPEGPLSQPEDLWDSRQAARRLREAPEELSEVEAQAAMMGSEEADGKTRKEDGDA